MPCCAQLWRVDCPSRHTGADGPLVRLIPASGRIVWNAADANVRTMLDMGCWTPCEGFAREPRPDAKWSARVADRTDYSSFEDVWRPFAAGVGPSGAYFCSLDEELRAALLAEWERRLGSPSGAFRLTARAWYAVGRA